MVNKIDGITGQRPAAPQPSQNPRSDRSDADRTQSAAQSTDQLSLTASAQLLRELNEAALASPDVDQGRIEAIRQAIAEGNYEINARRIVDKLLDLDDQL